MKPGVDCMAIGDVEIPYKHSVLQHAEFDRRIILTYPFHCNHLEYTNVTALKILFLFTAQRIDQFRWHAYPYSCT